MDNTFTMSYGVLVGLLGLFATCCFGGWMMWINHQAAKRIVEDRQRLWAQFAKLESLGSLVQNLVMASNPTLFGDEGQPEKPPEEIVEVMKTAGASASGHIESLYSDHIISILSLHPKVTTGTLDVWETQDKLTPEAKRQFLKLIDTL